MFKLKYFLPIETILIVVAAIGYMVQQDLLKSLASALCLSTYSPGEIRPLVAYHSCSLVIGKALFFVTLGLATIYLLGFIISRIAKKVWHVGGFTEEGEG